MMQETIIRIRRYGFPIHSEIIALFLVSIVGGFVFGFGSLFGTKDQLYSGFLSDIIAYSAVIFVLLLILDIARRWWAIRQGYVLQTSFGWSQMLLSIFLSVYTYGYVTLLFPPGFMMRRVDHLRVGKFPFEFRFSDGAKSALFGVVVGVVFIGLLTPFLAWPFVIAMMSVVVCSLVPIDILLRMIDKKVFPSVGTVLLQHTPTMLIFACVFVFVSFLLASIVPVWVMFGVAGSFACLFTFYYWWKMLLLK